MVILIISFKEFLLIVIMSPVVRTEFQGDSSTTQKIIVGGSGANYTNTTFSDVASKSISLGSAPFTGSFKL